MTKALVQLNLKISKEFLVVAEQAHEAGHYSAAHTNSINSAIRAKDALALHFRRRSEKSSNHQLAVKEIAGLPAVGNELASLLAKILKEKNRFEYQDEIPKVSQSLVQLTRARAFLQRVLEVTGDA